MTKVQRLVVTSGVTYEATPGQYWLQSESGKRWELWDETDGFLRRVTYLAASRVLWARPWSEEIDHNTAKSISTRV